MLQNAMHMEEGSLACRAYELVPAIIRCSRDDVYLKPGLVEVYDTSVAFFELLWNHSCRGIAVI